MSVAEFPELMSCEDLQELAATDRRARRVAHLLCGACATVKTLLGAAVMLALLNLAGSFL